MRLHFNIVLVTLIILLMAFVTVSCAANPGPTQINIIPDSYLDTTGGIYSVNLTASVSDASGNPVADGTMVDFTIKAAGEPSNVTSIYNPILTGGLNGNNSWFASVPTSGGKAVAHYGWFPDNKIPTGQVMITASLNNTPSIKTPYFLVFNGTTEVVWAGAPVVCPIPPSPVPSSTSTQTPGATRNPTPAPLPPIVALLSLTIGAAIVSAARRK
jgi:hypothetical protein